MKTKLIMTICAISFLLMGTDNLLQAVFALSIFLLTAYWIKKNSAAAEAELEKINNRLKTFLNI